MNPRMLVEFVDGCKTMVEMAAIANATGLIPDRPGMHGPACSRDDLNKVLVPDSAGGLLSSNEARVDYTIGKGVAPGVFVVAGAARAAVAIPCGLLTGARVTAPIAKGALITTANARVPEGSRIAALRARQDKMLGL